MKKQHMSATISIQELEAVTAALNSLRQQMPFLIALSPAERRRGSRVGLNHLGLAENSLMAARENPTIVPSSFDLSQFEHDVRVGVGLHKCLTGLKQLASDVQDTLQTVGAQAAKSSEQIRALVKAAAKTTPGLKLVAERLATRPTRAVGSEQTASASVPATPPPGPASEPKAA